MGKKRLNNINSQDVFGKNTGDTEVPKKRMTFSRAMIRLGAYVTYCVIFLLKKLNKMLCDSAKAFNSKTTALILGVIKKFKRVGRVILVPFVSCIKPIRKKFKATRAATDVTVSSVRDSKIKLVFSKAVNYAVPAAAILVFVTVLSSASKAESGISSTYKSGKATDIEMNIDSFVAASNELRYAEEASIDNSEQIMNKTVEFSEPYECIENLFGKRDYNFIDATGIYVGDKFLGTVVDISEVENLLKQKLDQIKSQPGIKSAEYKKTIEYHKGQYATTSVISAEDLMNYINGGNEERHYIVEEGDSLTLIAEQNNLTVEQLLSLNPHITDPDLCVIGTDLVVEAGIKNMPVVYTKTIEEITAVPYETMTVNNDSLFTGETEVLIDGVNGENKNVIDVHYNEQTEIGRDIVSVEKIKDPVAEMISVGTKQKPVSAAPASKETILKGNGQYILPVNGGYISDTFGGSRCHKGLDIAAGSGTSIYAGAAGTVTAAGWNTGGYGYFVMVDHGNGYVTLYAHMSKVLATTGAAVNCGDVIGEVGTTGDSTGNHLHFEVRYNNVCQNPADYLNVNAN